MWYQIMQLFMLKKIMISVLKNQNKKQNSGRRTESLCSIDNHIFINQRAFSIINAYVFNQSSILHKRKAKSTCLLRNHFFKCTICAIFTRTVATYFSIFRTITSITTTWLIYIRFANTAPIDHV